MDRVEAEAIALAGGEPARALVVGLLDALDQVAAAVDEVAGLKERIEELERQVNRTSRNSSVAPSSDPPLTRQQRRQLARERAKKQLERDRREACKQGGQPGHEGSSRPPADPEQLTAGPVDCVPGRCGCGHRFTGVEERVGEPVCHQQWDLPVIVPEVREWRRLRLACPGCGRPALAELPAGVSASAFGPRLHAHVAVLAGVCRLSREKLVELVRESYGIELSTGAVDMMLRRVSRVLHDPWRELHEAIKLAEAVHADETTWLCKADPCWLWTASTAALVCYRIDPRRTQEAAKKLLGENFGGFVTSDRYVGYHWLDVLQQQLCWAHAVRQLTEISERPGAPGKLGTRLLDIAGQVFAIHHEHAPALAVADRPEHPALIALREQLAPLRERFRALLEQGTRGRHPKTARFCAGLLEEYPALWTFSEVPGITPTNNDAERAMRGPVILRRISGGTQSERGNRWIERILSTLETCRRQGRSASEYLHDAIDASLHSRPIPTLVPG
ncbi:MAG: IS66 family transposase [Solirubrobacteraceae bacterium]